MNFTKLCRKSGSWMWLGLAVLALSHFSTRPLSGQNPTNTQRKISFKLIAFSEYQGTAKSNALPVAGNLSASVGIKLKTISLIDDANGKFVQLLEGEHNSDLSPVIAISEDNRIVAANDNDRYVRVWDVQTGRLLSLITVPFKKLDPIFGTIGSLSVSLSPDGKYVATGRSFSDRHVTIWEAESGKARFVLENPGNEQSVANSVEFSRDGKTLAAVFYNRIVLWDVETGRPLKQLKVTDDKTERHVYSVIYRLQFSPDGKLLGASNRNGKARIWEIESGKLKHTLEHKNRRADVIEFSRDGKLVATGSNDKTVKLWDVETGRLLRTFKHNKRVIGIDFSDPEFGLMLVWDDSWSEKTQHLWDITTGQLVEKGRIGGFSKDGKRMLRWIPEEKRGGVFEIVIER
jgi:WD40 repeat protein